MLNRIDRTILKAATFLTLLMVVALLMGASEARANWSQSSWGNDPSIYLPEIILSGGTVSDTETVTTFRSWGGGLDRYVFTMTGNSMTLYNQNGTSSAFSGQYSLTATFTASGQYLGGALTISGSVPGQTGSTLLAQSSNLQLMGLWGDNSSGGFEFVGAENMSANSYFKQFDPDVYVMATSVYISNSGALGAWDPYSNQNNKAFWARQFSGTATSATWAPIPGTIVLLGIGLAGVFSLKKRILAI